MNPKNIDEVRRVGSTAQRLKQLPYDKRVCRIEAHYPASVMPGEPFRDMSVDKYVEFIDEVPKTSVGKFSKKTLRDRFSEVVVD